MNNEIDKIFDDFIAISDFSGEIFTSRIFNKFLRYTDINDPEANEYIKSNIKGSSKLYDYMKKRKIYTESKNSCSCNGGKWSF